MASIQRSIKGTIFLERRRIALQSLEAERMHKHKIFGEVEVWWHLNRVALKLEEEEMKVEDNQHFLLCVVEAGIRNMLVPSLWLILQMA